MHSTIYFLNGHTAADGVQSQRACDETIRTAREIARQSRKSVVVEDRGTEECYRVTPGGHIWRSPKGWLTPTWGACEDE